MAFSNGKLIFFAPHKMPSEASHQFNNSNMAEYYNSIRNFKRPATTMCMFLHGITATIIDTHHAKKQSKNYLVCNYIFLYDRRNAIGKSTTTDTA